MRSCNRISNISIESVRQLFTEKSITYVDDYDEASIAQLMGRLEEQKNKTDSKETPTQKAEDIHTRIFLSHKRLTGQAIVGRYNLAWSITFLRLQTLRVFEE
jgi:hypothetical protein